MQQDVVIVAPRGNGSLAGYARALAASSGNPTVFVDGCSGTFGVRLLGGASLRALAADAATIRSLRRVDAPLLHLSSHHLARYGRFLRRPYVVTVHDLMRERDRLGRDTAPLIHEPNLRDSIGLRLDAQGMRRAAALIAVSDHTRRELSALLGIAPDRVTVVPEGVDRRAFRPVRSRRLGDPYVLYVGSEQPRKNLATLFRAFALARRTRPGLRLVKVGSPGGPEAPFRERTLVHAHAAGVVDAIVFADRVSHEDLVAWYSGAVCLVQPSLHEGFGLTPLEAMASGCPVLVSSGGALPEVVADAGIVYGAPEDAHALARHLSRLATQDRARDQLRRLGLRRAEAMSWTETARRTQAVYRAVMARHRVEPEQALGDLARRRRRHAEVGRGVAALDGVRAGDPAG